MPEAWPGAAADTLELAESPSMAFLVLLATFTPAEVGFAPAGETVGTVYVVLNPDKLRHWPSPVTQGGIDRWNPSD